MSDAPRKIIFGQVQELAGILNKHKHDSLTSILVLFSLYKEFARKHILSSGSRSSHPDVSSILSLADKLVTHTSFVFQVLSHTCKKVTHSLEKYLLGNTTDDMLNSFSDAEEKGLPLEVKPQHRPDSSSKLPCSIITVFIIIIGCET